MPRLHYVKKARKDWPSIGVKKGEGYVLVAVCIQWQIHDVRPLHQEAS